MKNMRIVKCLAALSGLLMVVGCDKPTSSQPSSSSLEQSSSSSEVSSSSSSSSTFSIPDETNDLLTFTLSEDGTYYIVSKVSAQVTKGVVVIPQTYNGKPVTHIAERGFSGSRHTCSNHAAHGGRGCQAFCQYLSGAARELL